MGGIACTPIQRLLQQPGLADARHEEDTSPAKRVEVKALHPPAGDAGASTSAAGRHGADDEKHMSRQDREKATERGNEDETEEVDGTNPGVGESGGKRKECPENGAMPMEKENHETLTERNTSSRKRERDEAVPPQLIPEEENGETGRQKKSNQDLVFLQRGEDQRRQPVQEKPTQRETDDDRIHHDISIDEADGGGDDEIEDQEDDSGEIVMNLDQVSGCQKMKFNIPGISQVKLKPRVAQTERLFAGSDGELFR